MPETYDAIVIGGRCAGAPTAMQLARAGQRVLLVDRATFPSDTMSTHVLHAPAVAALQRWGLLEALQRTGCPPIERYSVDFGPFALSGSPRPADGVSTAYCARRHILDQLLVEAAVEAGAELREAFTVDELLFEDGRVCGIRGHSRGGAAVLERSRVVVGADGKHSMVARAVDAPAYNERPTFAATYYAYWSALPVEELEVFIRPYRSWAAAPTHDGLTMVVASWPIAEFAANKSDVEGNVLATFEAAPEFAERIRGASRETRFVGSGELPGFYRRPYGPGWALVGDAGYHKDPCTAQGISDAFRDSELLAGALLGGGDGALAEYQRTRDETTMGIYELTCALATQEPPPPERAQFLASAAGDQECMDAFVSVMAGTLPPQEFFPAAPAEVAA